MKAEWTYLVSETQFASELVTTGIRRLCAVPLAEDALFVSDVHTYPLHVGLHAYTSGLERLCKLTIACDGFVNNGEFPPVRAFSHKIADLLDAVEALKVRGAPARPFDELDPTLTEMLERFASGLGRYEYLDFLGNDQTPVTTLQTWKELCRKAELSEHGLKILVLRQGAVEALRELCTQGDLEATGWAVIEAYDSPLYSRSAAVALRLFQKAHWIAATLDKVSYYTHEHLPILGEAMQELRASPDDFFQYSIAQIDDADVTAEELADFHQRRGQPVDEL